eukprot:CAMPEP_0117429998 /NCGR_PEP_ID=MMETSP0758-20121206/9520_1 /TAXON_ID=63605 /ORGANISM="Percolomonas cosmopolitus, Strain AE-1 (ATCC 50343)" /LENGTH=224 /DNA_ID=CAMNT_0005217543 /DNA_START=39 /DNA_END=710 /DNA_ORIENTATION=-
MTSTTRCYSNRMSTLHEDEVEKFSKLAHEWWNSDGEFRTLHDINPLRIQYIKKILGRSHFDGLHMLDVGCGGGIAAESMARLGAASVLGVDASQENIGVAKAHAARYDSLSNLAYHCGLVEQLKVDHQFDVVVSFEVIEHVRNPTLFVQFLVSHLKPGGHLILSTINRSMRSYLEMIVGAEYVTGLVPRGTHDHDKFVTPEELHQMLQMNQLVDITSSGYAYNP